MDFTQATRNLEEVLTEEELQRALASGKKLKHYIGFEISGKIHLGTGIVSMAKIKDLTDAGVECIVFLADWHTWINHKLGGADLETIKRVAVGYFREGMQASFRCVGGDPEKVRFVLGSDLYHANDGYWRRVMEVSKHTSLARAQRSITILGRKEGESVDFAQLIYPMMQVADIFALGVDIAHSGTDQRKAHVIARDVAPALGLAKPIALHHHLILGLGKPPHADALQESAHENEIITGDPDEEGRGLFDLADKEAGERFWETLKMSKSQPDSAIFIHDSPDEIRAKIKKAFCPPSEVKYNPILDWIEHVIFLGGEGELMLKRSPHHGGDIAVHSKELPRLYTEGTIHPEDLKNAVAERLIKMLGPARNHFASGAPKEMLEELEVLIKKPS